MRAGPLSDDAIGRLIGQHFVPVWVSRDRYGLPPATRDEVEFVRKMDASRRDQKLVGGAVAVYLVGPDAAVLDCLRVQDASKPAVLREWLTRHVRDHRLTKRDAPTPAAAGAPTGFVVRTKLEGKPDRGTSRDAVALTKAQIAALLPASAKSGEAYDVPREAAVALLRHAYPPLPAWDAKLVKLERAELRATPTDADTFRLAGRVTLVYPAHGKPTDGTVEATLVGVARRSGGELCEWVLVSDRATYTWRWEGKPSVRPMALSVELVGGKGVPLGGPAR